MQRSLIGACASGLALGVILAGVLPAAADSPKGPPPGWTAHTPLRTKVIGTLPDGTPKFTSSSPTGLPPSAIKSVYSLAMTGGSGQVIAIVDAYDDPNAGSDLNTFAKYYFGSSVRPNFQKVYAQGSKPSTNSGWALEESLDIEWAFAQAPAAKIVLVEAASSSFSNLFGAVQWANRNGATVVSMSWLGSEFSGETGDDGTYFSGVTNGTPVLYTASSGDNGHGTGYPAASPNVIAVGGTTLNGCSGTSCSFSSESTWSSSGGGISPYEAIPSYQSGYSGPTFGAASISALTGGMRGIPDVSFDGNPNTGVSVYDSTRYQGQSGWFTLGGTSVGAPNWAGILAAGASAGQTALQGNSQIYAHDTDLRDIASGANGSCGTDCTAGTGYDLVTGLGSPVNYP